MSRRKQNSAQASEQPWTAAHCAALQTGRRAPVKPGDHVGKELGGDFDKQIAEKVFHGGSALWVGNAHSLLSRPRQLPLVGFPTQFQRGATHHLERLSHFPKASRPAPRQAMNTPIYCRETGLRIGVCPCPRCSQSKKDQQQ
ncbi:hypothetical protein [Pseudomonas sp. C11]|uniref:hypothetical protein n=1 Tax=Pseudomonas sp. C11 TaxID=3075550 RepID=UPI002AFF26B5|nr:hypothetical protein [Pseudomonas sp. C11]